jgi:hypothetical protein
MSQPIWLELKRTDFLAALQEIKPTLKVKSAPERQLQIGYVDGRVVFSIQGALASKPAAGDWPGIAQVRLDQFLSFLIAKPTEPVVRIAIVGEKLHVATARFAVTWDSTGGPLAQSELARHARSTPKELRIKLRCPICDRVQGVSFDWYAVGPLGDAKVMELVHKGQQLGHGFGCLRCGGTWNDQLF